MSLQFTHGANSSIPFGQPDIIVSVTVTESRIEIVKRQPSNMTYMCNPPKPAPDKVWKEIYEVVNGRLERRTAFEIGTHVPAHFVPETIIWEASK
jgi:hypothetical protein